MSGTELDGGSHSDHQQQPQQQNDYRDGIVSNISHVDEVQEIKQEKKITPLSIPLPDSVESLQILLTRYRELDSQKLKSEIFEAEKLGILKSLQKIDDKQEEYKLKLNSLEESWKTSKNEVNLDLLKQQLASFQLLAKDLDLPRNLQESLIYEYELSDEDDEDAAGEPLPSDKDDNSSLKSSESNNSLSKETEPEITDETEEEDLPKKFIDIPLENFEEKAKLLGLKTELTKVDPEKNAAGNAQCERLILSKIMKRSVDLEKLPSNIGSYDVTDVGLDLLKDDEIPPNIDEFKIKSLIELKSLRLLSRQKKYRESMILRSANNAHYTVDFLKNSSIVRSAQRSLHIRKKIIAPQTARLAEQLEEKQKQEQRIFELNKQIAKVSQQMEVIDEVLREVEDRKSNKLNLGRNILHYHQQAEKEEAKRIERNAKQRLQALRSNDEEAYLKLLDQTKDTRITHLLRQTNSFLDSLANAVKVQQEETRVKEDVEKTSAANNDRDVTLAEAGGSGSAAAIAAIDADEEDEDAKREKIDYYEVAHKIKETITKQASLLVGGTLKEYQLKGLEWMVSLYNNHLNGILADEMGLGKTIQSISLITYLIESKKETGKFLVIVPLSTITNWTLEFEKWAPGVNTVVYKGSQQQRKQLQYQIKYGNFTVLLTTFEYIIRDRPLLSKFKWAHMIIDEGHRMKNAQSKLSLTLNQYYHTRNRLILTGTPLQNNLPELWALLNFILPKVFNSVKSFDEWFNTPFANTGHQDKLELTEEESLLIIRRLHKVLRPFLLRRLKKDVEKDLPDKIEKVVKCKFSSLQNCIYKQMLEHNALFVGAGVRGATKSGLKGLNNKIMQLRKICNHPFVFEEVEDAINPSRLTTDMIWRSSGKFELLDRILPKFKATGHRVLIFFQMTQVMDIMEDFLRYRDMKYMRLDGSTKADDRQLMLQDFNAPDSDYFCFLLSTRAGGLGLNLQTADTVIIFDTDWNPHQDLQAQDRAHRIGQKNEVRILRLITDDSVEEIVLERAHQKLDIDGKVIQAGKFDNKSSAEEQEAFLKRLLEAEKSKSKDDENEDFEDDDELNEILARSEDEKIIFAEMDRQRKEDDDKKFGLNHSRLLTEDELPPVFHEDIQVHIQKDATEEIGRTRERKRVIYDDGLTEEQWLDAMDAEDDTVEDAILRKRESLARRRAKKSLKEEGEEEDDEADDDNAGGDLEDAIGVPNDATVNLDDKNDPAAPEEEINDVEKESDATEKVIVKIKAVKRRSPKGYRKRSKTVKQEIKHSNATADNDDDEEVFEPPAKRRAGRRGRAISVEAEESEEPKVKEEPQAVKETPLFVKLSHELLDKVTELEADDGRKRSDLFVKAPSRRFYPDYYKLIKKAVSLSELRKKLDQGFFNTFDEFLEMLKLMFTNAKIYNQEGSWVYNDAIEMERLVDSEVVNIKKALDESSSTVAPTA
ncbi:hypothetical protein BVG19_g5318 [[Candida] boidinii]|nr:hypothetical protein BVG19_g5318 [[Candida] boidinii]OWB51334.1 hypothetical protein B5S27_g2894 [[Candida] boidinii]